MMIVVNGKIYGETARWLYKKFFKPEKRDEIDLLIKKERKYIESEYDENLREKSNNLVKKMGGFNIRI